MFLIKKWIAAFIMPLPLAMVLLFVGLALLLFTQKQKMGKVFVALGCCWLLLFSTPWVTRALLAPLEQGYPYHQQLEADYIVVLGAGLYLQPQLPLSSQLSHSALGTHLGGGKTTTLKPT